MPTKQIEDHLSRFKELEDDRIEWVNQWKDISEYILPRRGVFEDRLPNQGERRQSRIIDGTATRALRVLAAGMQGGLTSPSRPWFRLKLEDEELAEFGPIREWLDDVEQALYSAKARSNFYDTTHTIYSELPGFGTACVLLEDDPDYRLRYKVMTAGEYYLGSCYKDRVDTLYRKFWMTAGQMAHKFGTDSISKNVRQAAEKTPYTYFSIIHCIRARHAIDYLKLDSFNMPWESIYFEYENDNNLLMESGYEEKPFMAPRWDIAGADVYGRGPCDDILPDVKMLQEMQKGSIKAIHLGLDPPLAVPSNYNQKVKTFPGGINYFDTNQRDGFGRLFDFQFDIGAVEGKIERVQMAIREGLFNDLFLMILERPQMTATEVVERHEEKLLLLGPVIERQQNELLNPDIDRTFAILYRNGYIPPPPAEIQGQDLKIEYISLLAQAQRLVGTQSINSTAAFVGNLAPLFPDVTDKFDADQAVDEYAAMTGAPARIIRSDDAVARIRRTRIEQQQAQAQMMQAQQAAQIGKEISQIDTKPGNPLGDLARSLEIA